VPVVMLRAGTASNRLAFVSFMTTVEDEPKLPGNCRSACWFGISCRLSPAKKRYMFVPSPMSV
jgi:hypothetical protein